MSVEQIVFYLFAVLVLGSALIVVTINNLVRSIFVFFVVLFGLAGLYIFALADFIAVSQVIIYVGGVLVMMLFAFLLSNKELLSNLQGTGKFMALASLPGILIVLVLFFILTSAISASNIADMTWINSDLSDHLKPTDNTVHNIGINIMTRYLLPFEIVSVFLMMALIGAAHMARKGPKS